jgi:hypothetical protein
MERKKSPMPKRAVKKSYEEPMRPVKPHSTSDKGKWQDKGNIKSDKKKR